MQCLSPVYLQPVLQAEDGAVEGGWWEIVGNVQHLGNALCPVGFHHLAANFHHELAADFIGLTLGHHRLLVPQSQDQPHSPTRVVGDIQRDPESLTCESEGETPCQRSKFAFTE